MNDIQGLARFVASVIRTPSVVSIRLREGDDRAKAAQVGRILKTEESTASHLQREVIDRIDGIASIHCVHIEAMTASDAEILDYVTALPVRATKIEKREAGDVIVGALERLALSANERSERANNTVQDLNKTIQDLHLTHFEERLEWLEENQELRKQLEAQEPPPNPLVENAVNRAITTAEKLAVAYGISKLGVGKKAAHKAIEGPTAQTPQSTTTNATGGGAELTIIDGGRSTPDPQSETSDPESSEEVELAAFLTVNRREFLVVAKEDPAYAGILAEHYLSGIVGMMEDYKDEFTGERLGVLLPHLDMGAIMAAFTGAVE